MRFSFLFIVAALLLAQSRADLYMHNPPGSNGRCWERNDNRDNDNRIMDTQNNGAGGYSKPGDAKMLNAPDPLTYYSGSILRLEWTNQHACGKNPNIQCELIMQWACDLATMPGARDGYASDNGPGALVSNDPDNTGYLRRRFRGGQNNLPGVNDEQNQRCTQRIPTNAYPNDAQKRSDFYYLGAEGGIEFGMNEGIDYFTKCGNRERNRGLYSADQGVSNNQGAFATRQNAGGTTRGLECPEERDYYPYWAYSPWVDSALLVSEGRYCDYFKENSQNVVDTWECICDQTCRNNANLPGNKVPITQTKCETSGGTWQVTVSKSSDSVLGDGVGKPDCKYHPWNRDNHLGNSFQVDRDGNPILTDEPTSPFFNWEIPEAMEDKGCCYLRMRYNMSANDYPSHAHAEPDSGEREKMWDSKKNCPTKTTSPHCGTVFNEETIPVGDNRPYVKMFNHIQSLENTPELSVIFNTNQVSRTFQDRSYCFMVTKRPSNVLSSSKIVNLNVRGRKGNIVQCYPSVERDFVPQIVHEDEGTWVHIQLHGSEFNAAKNPNNGDGWRFSTRANIIQTPNPTANFPIYPGENGNRLSLFNLEQAEKFAFLGQDYTQCEPYENGQNNEQNSITNCGKLNASPARFPLNPAEGLVKLRSGSYSYMSTRNNNFSNRSQKGQIIVENTGLTTAEVVAIAVSVVAVVGLAVGGVCFYAYKHPESRVGRLFNRRHGVTQVNDS